MSGLMDLIESMRGGAAGNAGNIIKLRQAFEDYRVNGGTLSWEEYARAHGANTNTWKNKTS